MLHIEGLKVNMLCYSHVENSCEVKENTFMEFNWDLSFIITVQLSSTLNYKYVVSFFFFF